MKDFNKILKVVGIPLLIGLGGVGLALLIKELFKGNLSPVYNPWSKGEYYTPSSPSNEETIERLKELLKEANKLLETYKG